MDFKDTYKNEIEHDIAMVILEEDNELIASNIARLRPILKKWLTKAIDDTGYYNGLTHEKLRNEWLQDHSIQ